MNVWETVLNEHTLQNEQLEGSFDSLKSNNNSGFDNISSSPVNFCICDTFHTLKYF